MSLNLRQRLTWLLIAVLAVTLLPVPVSAAQITSRSLTLVNGVTDGGSKPGGVVNHLFSFTLPSVGNTNVGSIKFEYCTTASGTCTMPTGLVSTSATLGAQTGATGFTIVNTTNGAPYITRTAAAVTAGTAVTIRLDTVTNPTGAPGTFFVRMNTYASIDTTGGVTDFGTVAASTAQQITLTGTMPESLIFCTGGTISTTGGVPDCSTATSGSVTFNQEFSPATTSTTTSQMAASTNAGFGYAITVSGATMSSGANTIAGISAGSGSTSVKGTGQFGLNLRANTTSAAVPAFGADVAAASNGTNFKANPLTGYNAVDTFKFVSGNTVADSSNGGAGPTDAQIYTASYIVNVAGSQPAGTYTTTLTYVCTATF